MVKIIPNLRRSLLTLSLETMSLKLLASQGEKVLAWSLTPINPRFLRGGFVANQKELANVIKTAVSKEGFNTRHRVLASLPAFHSVSRVLELPDLREVRPEVAIPQQAKRDMGYAAENSLLFWKSLTSRGGRQRFFVVAVAKEPVITLIETLKLAGLPPDSIETDTFALSRAVNERQAIIVAMEPNSLDSIILRDGIPLSTQSTFLGETPQDMESLSTRVMELFGSRKVGKVAEQPTGALGSIISLHNESHPDDPLPPDTPIYLLGSAVALNPNIATAVETALRRPVTEFNPPLLYPPDFPKTELAVNIGLVLKEL